MEEIQSETTIEIDGVKITPIALDHIVPALGFILEDDEAAIAIVSDTSPTNRIWEVINEQKKSAGRLSGSQLSQSDGLVSRKGHAPDSEHVRWRAEKTHATSSHRRHSYQNGV
jgi:hypothetical protein